MTDPPKHSHSREGRKPPPLPPRNRRSWTSAFAGVTTKIVSHSRLLVIPAKAGIQRARSSGPRTRRCEGGNGPSADGSRKESNSKCRQHRPNSLLKNALALDLPCTLVPNRRALIKVRVVRHVDGDGGVVAELGILNGLAPRFDRLEKIPQMIAGIVIARRRVEICGRVNLLAGRFRLVLFAPLLGVRR